MNNGKGWWEEPQRHSLAARGIRTTYDELQDRHFTPSYRSVAAILRERRLVAMRKELNDDYTMHLRSRNRFSTTKDDDLRKLMMIYRRNNQIPGGVPRFQARGIWSGLKRAGRKVKRTGAAVKRGAKRIGRGAKQVAPTIRRGARRVGRAVAGPEGSRRRRIGGVVERGARALGGVVRRGATALRSRFEPRTYIVDSKNFRRTNDLRGDNITRRMNIDELAAEQKRLDQSNRALMMQMGMRNKWNNRRVDLLGNRRRIHSRETDYQRLEMEMFR